MLDRILIALFPGTMHRATAKVLTAAHKQRIIRSKTLHALTDVSGALFKRPGHAAAKPAAPTDPAHPDLDV